MCTCILWRTFNFLVNSLSTDILGNAYLSLFFSGAQSPQILKQCMTAYSQAVSIQTMLDNCTASVGGVILKHAHELSVCLWFCVSLLAHPWFKGMMPVPQLLKTFYVLGTESAKSAESWQKQRKKWLKLISLDIMRQTLTLKARNPQRVSGSV